MELSAEWPGCSVNMKAAKTAQRGSQPILSARGHFQGGLGRGGQPRAPGCRRRQVTRQGSTSARILETGEQIQLFVLSVSLANRVIF